MVLAFYKVMETHLSEWLPRAIDAVWEEVWRAVFQQGPNDEEHQQFHGLSKNVEVAMILPSGGRECNVSFVVAPRRNNIDATWQGTHLLDNAWQYIALSRASGACYLFTENLKFQKHPNWRPEKKRKRWISLQEFGEHTWQELHVRTDWQQPCTSEHHCPQIFGSQVYWDRCNIPWQYGMNALEIVVEHMRHLTHLSAMIAMNPTDDKIILQQCLADRELLYVLPKKAKQANIKKEDMVKLPSLGHYRPTTSRSDPQDSDELYKAHWQCIQNDGYRFLDAITVHIKQSQMCICLPLLMVGPPQSDVGYNSNVVNNLAFALFDLWELPKTASVFEKHVVRHKKNELEGCGDGESLYFVEAMCWSDRPAWTIELEDNGEEVFHFYNAMGLTRQHPDLQSLLVRIQTGTTSEAFTLAASFISHVVSCLTHIYYRPELVTSHSQLDQDKFGSQLELFGLPRPDSVTIVHPDFAGFLDSFNERGEPI